MSGAYFTSLDYFYGKTYCWSNSNGDLHKRELSATNSVMVIVASIVSMLFVLYGPLLVQLLTQRNKPLRSRENNEVWLANDTDLPVGLKYSLFHLERRFTCGYRDKVHPYFNDNMYC